MHGSSYLWPSTDNIDLSHIKCIQMPSSRASRSNCLSFLEHLGLARLLDPQATGICQADLVELMLLIFCFWDLVQTDLYRKKTAMSCSFKLEFIEHLWSPFGNSTTTESKSHHFLSSLKFNEVATPMDNYDAIAEPRLQTSRSPSNTQLRSHRSEVHSMRLLDFKGCGKQTWLIGMSVW